jgi:hypothetical protein
MGAEALRNALSSMLQSWLSDHPILGWCATHPLWALALLLLFVFFAWGLLRAIARLVETLWLMLLQVPIRFSRWMVRQLVNRFKPSKTKVEKVADLDSLLDPSLTPASSAAQIVSSESNQPDQPDHSAHLSSIVARLEQLQKDQIQLLQDVQALLHPPTAEAQPHRSTLKSLPQSSLIPNRSPELVDRS